MGNFDNPLDVLGLPRSLVTEVWTRNIPQSQKAELLVTLAKQTVRGYSKALHSDASGWESNHLPAMNLALDLFEVGAVPTYVEWWLNPSDHARIRAERLAREADQRKNDRLSALYEMLGRIDRSEIEGASGDIELALEGASREIFGACEGHEGYLLRAVGRETLLFQFKPVSAERVQYYDLRVAGQGWSAFVVDYLPSTNLNVELEHAIEPINPISVRVVGAIDRCDLEASQRSIYLGMPKTVASPMALAAWVDEEPREPSQPLEPGLLWVHPSDAWWLREVKPRVGMGDYLVVAKPGSDGDLRLAIVGAVLTRREL